MGLSKNYSKEPQTRFIASAPLETSIFKVSETMLVVTFAVEISTLAGVFKVKEWLKVAEVPSTATASVMSVSLNTSVGTVTHSSVEVSRWP
jgi:hypothetical protein